MWREFPGQSVLEAIRFYILLMYGECWRLGKTNLKTKQFRLTRRCQCSNIYRHHIEKKNGTEPIDGRKANNIMLTNIRLSLIHNLILMLSPLSRPLSPSSPSFVLFLPSFYHLSPPPLSLSTLHQCNWMLIRKSIVIILLFTIAPTPISPQYTYLVIIPRPHLSPQTSTYHSPPRQSAVLCAHLKLTSF